MKELIVLASVAYLLALPLASRADEPFVNEGSILAISREDQAKAHRRITLTDAIKVLTTYKVVTHDQYLAFAHKGAACGSATLKRGVTCLWEIEPGYAAIVTLPGGNRVYLLCPDLEIPATRKPKAK